MRLLIVHPQMASYGGAEVVIVRMVKHLQAKGHTADVATLSVKDNWPEYEGIKFLTPRKQMPYRLRGLRRLPDIFTMHALMKALCTTNLKDYDAINVHNFPAAWSSVRERPTVWLCNEVPDLWHSNGMPWIARQIVVAGKRFDRAMVRGAMPITVVPDERCARRVRDRYDIQPHIIPYGIDSFNLKPAIPLQEPFTILHPAMVSPSKQQLSVLEAVVSLRARGIMSPHIIFSGYYEPDHPYSRMLHQYIHEHNLSVEFVGLSDRQILQGLYSRAHMAVFPGKGQGSWLGPFEQVTVGNPVVVSHNLTCSDLVKEKRVGLVFDNLSDAIQEVYENYPWYCEQTLKARDYVMNELTWARFTDKMMELMQ